MKRRILLVISSDLFVRNYLRTSVFAALEDEFDVRIAASEAVTLREDVEAREGFMGYFPTDPATEMKHYRYFNILIFRYQDRSRTFPFRLNRMTGWYLPEAKDRARKNRRLLMGNLRRLKDAWSRRAWDCVLFGNRLVFPLFRRFYEWRLRINPELDRLIGDAHPDLLIFPSNAYDPAGNDAIRIARRRGIKSVYLIDNWDNLCSKSVFWAAPDYLGVWSRQQAEHAERIHRFPAANVFPIGTPRFGHYLEKRGRSGKSHFDFPYVIFSGCCLPFDESEPLQILERELEQNSAYYGELKIVYRPHPWRQKRKREGRFCESEYNHVVLDPQVRDEFLANYQDMSTRTQFQPDINYYPSLIDNARFIIGPLTTFLIETLIFHKPFLGLCYDDGAHLTSPHNAFRYYEMYDGIENHEGVTLVRERDDLAGAFRALFDAIRERKVEGAAWDQQLDYFLRMDDVPYPERLRTVVRGVLG